MNETMRPEKAISSTSEQVTTPLILAVENGHFELAAALLKAGADPNDRPQGFTALHAITWVRKPIRGDGNPPPIGSGNLSSLEFVRQLVAHGADVNVRLENGESGRGRIHDHGFDAVSLSGPRLGRAADEDSCSNWAPIRRPRTPTTVRLCWQRPESGRSATATKRRGPKTKRSKRSECCWNSAPNVNAVDNNGETAMHGAAYQSRSKLVQLLAERGADINVWNRKNKSGWTPLMIAQGHRPREFPTGAGYDCRHRKCHARRRRSATKSDA